MFRDRVTTTACRKGNESETTTCPLFCPIAYPCFGCPGVHTHLLEHQPRPDHCGTQRGLRNRLAPDVRRHASRDKTMGHVRRGQEAQVDRLDRQVRQRRRLLQQPLPPVRRPKSLLRTGNSSQPPKSWRPPSRKSLRSSGIRPRCDRCVVVDHSDRGYENWGVARSLLKECPQGHRRNGREHDGAVLPR
jgi:hypothetical protein